MADQEETKPTETKVEETAEDKKEEEPAKAAEEEKPKEEKKEEPKEEESTATFEPVVSYLFNMLLLVFMFGYTMGVCALVLIDIQRFIYVLYRGWVRSIRGRRGIHHQQLIFTANNLWCTQILIGIKV